MSRASSLTIEYFYICIIQGEGELAGSRLKASHVVITITLHTYTLTLYPKEEAETYQVFLRDIHIVELDGPAVSALGVRSRKLSNIGRSSDG
jgi:hypothetical protein